MISASGEKHLLPPLGRRDFCRPLRLGPLQGPEVDAYGVGATLWVTWKGAYDQANKVEREWNRHDDREALQERLERLAERAAESPPPRWGFAGRVRQHIISKGPREFASSVRALIEGLVTAYQHEAPAMSSFSVDRHFSGILPFLTLDEKLPGADDVHLDPSNFTLPVPPVESPWPPSESSVTHPVYVHASRMLAARDAQTNGKSRNRVQLPLLPTMPIPINFTPCETLLLHPGRIVAAETGEALIPLALVSMLVNAQMPPEFTLAVTAHAYVAPTEGGSRSPPPPTTLPPVLFRRDDFAQEGPTGPIEAKQTLALSVGAEARLLVTFEVPERLVALLGFAPPAPLLVEGARARPP